jgi:hypothetical protein
LLFAGEKTMMRPEEKRHMARQKQPTIAAALLEALHYTSTEEAALDMLLLSARSRCTEYSLEVQQFEAKYPLDFATFQRLVETRENEEDFAQAEDLIAWRFAQDATDYWRQKTEELKLAAGDGEAIRWHYPDNLCVSRSLQRAYAVR